MTALAYTLSPDLKFVRPYSKKLDRSIIDEIEMALELEDIGTLDGARALLRRLEDRLGVTDFDRVSALAPSGSVRGPFVPLEGSQERRDRLAVARAAKPVPAPQKSTRPVHPNVLTMEMQRRWDKAERKIKIARTKAERDLAIDARIRLEREWRERIENARRDEQIAETVRLERARGATDKDFEVSKKPEHFGRIRIRTRDGLEIARAHLTRNQYAAAEQYRSDYERADPERGLKSAMGEGGAMSPPENPLRDAEALLRVQRRAHRGERLRKIDTLVFAATGPMGVTALHEVVGKARCIQHLTTSGSVKARYSSKLIEALDVIADHLGLQ